MKTLTSTMSIAVFLTLAVIGCEDASKPAGMITAPETPKVTGNSAPAQNSIDKQDPATTRERDFGEENDSDDRGGVFVRRFRPEKGHGRGLLKLTVLPGNGGFSVDIRVLVIDLSPNATYYVERAPEVGRPLSHDGIGQRALGLWPWEQPNSPGYPPVPAFVTFPRPNAGNLQTITTSQDGDGHVEFRFDLPSTILPTGTVFDVVFRIVDNSASPSLELRTKCFTVTVI